jgi:hypothetical protein
MVMESQKIKNTRHYVYDTIEEFHDTHKGKSPLGDWRKGKEGDWVWSDDGRIIQLLKVSHKISHPNDRKNYKNANGWVRTVVGTFLNTPKTKMDTDFFEHPNRYTFSKKIKNTNSRIRTRETCTNKEKVFATTVATGKDVVSSYMEAFTEANRNSARKKAVILLKQRRIMSEIERTSKEIAKELGIDHEYILGSLKQLADTSEDQNIALQSLKELGKAIGTLGSPVKRIETGVVGLFQGFDPKEIEEAKRNLLPAAQEEV